VVQDLRDNGVTNQSGNRPFEDVLQARMTRRGILAKGAALSATGFLAAIAGDKLLSRPAAAASGTTTADHGVGTTLLAQRRNLVGFNPVSIADGTGPDSAISSDYEYQVLIPWGTPIKPGVPEYAGDPNTRPSSEEQLHQIGIGHDGMWLFPFISAEGDPFSPRNNDSGVLCINHEFGTNSHVLGKDLPESLEDVRLSQHAHGVSVVEVAKVNGTWEVVIDSDKNRRITPNTPVTFSGPAAGHPLLQNPAGNAPQGTVNNCGNGYTPWGTYLTCEENFNGYFNNSQVDQSNPPTNAQLGEGSALSEADPRYGITPVGFGYAWGGNNGEVFDPRFDTSNPDYVNERNRFGWVVEIDPMNPDQPPVKRTALGRFKHESAHLVLGSNNRAVVYMGDDQRFDYIYKFVSNWDYNVMMRNGNHPLDKGVLFVAKFKPNGKGQWMPLTIENPLLADKFADQGELLVNTRIAADILGATPMDRPEWISSIGDDVYCCLTNNSRRTEANAANPLVPNPDGHIIKIKAQGNHISPDFTWDITIKSVDTHGEGDERTFSDPDGLWADPDGRLFIETDGGQQKDLNNQLVVASSYNLNNIRRLYTGPALCEVTGFAVTPDQRTMFINVQHPGNGDASATNFPLPTTAGDPTIPRDATVVITRKDGRKVGT
jgi:secreted PhoX family phosphatase